MSRQYTMCMSLENQLCVVVGAGRIAYRKTDRLIAAGARVRVISPSLDPRFTEWIQDGKIQMLQRPFQQGDTIGAMLTFAATNQPGLNRQIAEEVKARGGLVNVVDDKTLCTFTVPAEWATDNLSIAISTGGKSPRTAKQLRLLLEQDIADGRDQFIKAVQNYVVDAPTSSEPPHQKTLND